MSVPSRTTSSAESPNPVPPGGWLPTSNRVAGAGLSADLGALHTVHGVLTSAPRSGSESGAPRMPYVCLLRGNPRNELRDIVSTDGSAVPRISSADAKLYTGNSVFWV